MIPCFENIGSHLIRGGELEDSDLSHGLSLEYDRDTLRDHIQLLIEAQRYSLGHFESHRYAEVGGIKLHTVVVGQLAYVLHILANVLNMAN